MDALFFCYGSQHPSCCEAKTFAAPSHVENVLYSLGVLSLSVISPLGAREGATIWDRPRFLWWTSSDPYLVGLGDENLVILLPLQYDASGAAQSLRVFWLIITTNPIWVTHSMWVLIPWWSFGCLASFSLQLSFTAHVVNSLAQTLSLLILQQYDNC